MNFLEIKLTNISESETNPRGDIDEKKLEDLVSSIKEKGVLVPIIVRPQPPYGSDGVNLKNWKGNYEIVAGHRRFRAAKLAGLKTIPAEVKVMMDDDEAREIQIIENLQREDVHPIDEGLSYRQLVEVSGYGIATIAVRVGKSETYVRQRLFLANLSKKAAAAYRAGQVKSTRSWGPGYVKVNDSHMLMLAKLSHADQDKVIKEYISEKGEVLSVSDLKEYIDENIYDVLSNQPWLNEKGAMEAVGPCKECKPDTLTLFGEIKDGACTDTRCWKRKMGHYIFWKMEKDKIEIKVTKSYRTEDKIILDAGKYEEIERKKDWCDHVEKAIVAEGSGAGEIINICRCASCKKHAAYKSNYELTPEEKKKRQEERQKEAEKEKRKKDKENSELLQALQKIKDPITVGVADVMIEMMICDSQDEECKFIGERHGWEPVTKTEKLWSNTEKVRTMKDWRETVRREAANMDLNDKLRLIFELMYQTTWTDPRRKALDGLSKE